MAGTPVISKSKVKRKEFYLLRTMHTADRTDEDLFITVVIVVNDSFFFS